MPEITGCHFQPRLVDDGLAIDCFAQAGLPITQFGADLHWPDGRSLQLMLPFPRQGAAFARVGQVLPAVERVPLDRLAAVQVVVHTPTGGSRFYLEGRVRNTYLNEPVTRQCGNLSRLPAVVVCALRCIVCRSGSPPCWR